jgi:hypothetical protein
MPSLMPNLAFKRTCASYAGLSHMRSATSIQLSILQFFCAAAFAQPTDHCTPMLAHKHLSSSAGNSSGFSVGIDARGQAGFSPAVLVTFTVPAGAPPAQFVGAIELKSSSGSQVLELRRAEYWLLGSAPRVATPVNGMPTLSPRDAKVDTLYRLFFGVPESAPPEFTLLLPSPVLEGEAVPVPPLRFRRAEGKGDSYYAPHNEA